MSRFKLKTFCLILIFPALLIVSCRRTEQSDTYRTEKTSIQENEKDMTKTEITKISNSAGQAFEHSLTSPKNNTRAKPALTSLRLDGYPGKIVNGNVDSWVLSALADNPNIIEQIENTGEKPKITSILGDAFGQLGGGIVSVDIAENRGFDGGRAIAVTSLKTGVYGDIDYRIARLKGTRLDWTGAKEAWFYVDASDYGRFGVKIGFAIQEKNKNSSGELTDNYESWGISVGSEVRIYDTGKSSGWESVKVTKSASTDWNPGRIELPAGFRGWAAVTLDTEHMSAYWASNTKNNVLDLADVNQFQICVEGNSGSVGGSVYLSGYSIVGEGFDKETPVEGLGDGCTFTCVLPLDELEIASGETYSGEIMPWYDEFPGKLLTGIAFNYLLNPTDELKSAGDELSDALKNAQNIDGYLGIYTGDEIFGGGGRNWDVWGHYHMIYSLLCWHRASGNSGALETAVKAADCVYAYFVEGKRTFDSAGEQTMNLSISHVFAELYKETGDKRYLDAAVQIVEEDWVKSGNWMNLALEGKEYYQSPLPRWEALHTIMTLGSLWEITGEEKYYAALENIWWSIVKTDRHNTGGFSSGEAACGDPYNTGAIETCCTVAWMALSSEYLQLSRNSLAADELELSFYNGMLGSLLDGERYTTYNTPMQGGVRIASQTDIAFQYNSGSPDFNCCQANVSRGLGELSQWALLTDGRTLYLNYYGETVINAKTPGGQEIVIVENTRYPLDGAVSISISGLKDEEVFDMALRIPSWAMGSTVTSDGEVIGVEGGQYCTLRRTWKNGDTVTLSLGMSFHTWTSEANPTEASVYYGPILLSAEGSPFSAEPKFSYKDFAKAFIRLEDDGKHWMSVEIESDGEKYTFYDFASVGKFSPYSTWFKMDNIPARKSTRKAGSPIWCGTMLY